jgi:hypothetical protein
MRTMLACSEQHGRGDGEDRGNFWKRKVDFV